MDLHDYKDVAENYDLYLDVMYSKKDNYEGFKDFYLDLAKEYGGQGVIDIACGTGAVLLHLAEAGIDIDGTDLSEAMCNVARSKAEAKGLHLNMLGHSSIQLTMDTYSHVLPDMQEGAVSAMDKLLNGLW